MISIEKALQTLGLTETETLVYLELLKTGTSPASVVAKRLKINRCTAKYTLENLCKKHLAMMIEKNNTFYFSPENPEQILFVLKTEKEKIERKETIAKQILGDLKRMKNPNSALPKVQFFEGVEGVKKVLNDSLTTKTEILTFSDVGEYMKYFKEYNVNEYAPVRKKKKIFERVIIPNSKIAMEYMAGYEANDYTEVVFIDHHLFSFASEVNIYDNKVSFVTFSETGNHVGIIIENEEITRTLKCAFEMSWQLGKLQNL